MDKNAKIYIAGHRGMVGSALLRRLRADGFRNVVMRTHAELDLTSQAAVNAFFESEQPEYVFLAAAKNGGIRANSAMPAQFLYENLMIESNVIHAAYRCGAKKLVFTASVYAYPADAAQPISEDAFLAGKPVRSSEGYAIAKISGIELCSLYRRQYGTDFIAAVLPHIYGPGDRFDAENATVLPALIRKFYHAKRNNLPFVELWGTGAPLREFLYVDDLADALLFLAERYSGEEPINISAAEEVCILELAHMIGDAAGYGGEIHTDPTKPDGVYRNKLDGKRMRELGWQPTVGLHEGIRQTYDWYVKQESEGKMR